MSTHFKGILIIFLVGIVSPIMSMPPSPEVGGVKPWRPSLRPQSEQDNYALRLCKSKRDTHAKHSSSTNYIAYEEPQSESKGLCILVNFSDLTFQESNTKADFDSMANGLNYTFDGAIGSVREYFREQSGGLYVPRFDLYGPVTLSHPYAWYGKDTLYRGNDRYPVDFVLDACYAAKQLGADFSQYDEDGDGMVDFVYIIYAGYGQADGGSSNCIWPFEWDIESALAFGNTSQQQDSFYVNMNWNTGTVISERLPQIDGKTINKFACSNELRHNDSHRLGICTMCHEFSHVLGLPDYYVTQDDSPMAYADEEPGRWSLMSSGSYNNNGKTPPNYSVYDKFYLGWAKPTFLSQPQIVSVPADGQTYFYFKSDRIEPQQGPFCTDTVWYIENRQLEGWDAYLPGHGIVTWQIMYDANLWEDNVPNDYSTRCGISDVITGTGTMNYNYDNYVPSALPNTTITPASSQRYSILGQPVENGKMIIENGKVRLEY